MENISTRIRELRKGAKLNQEELGALLRPCASDATVSRWETGKAVPDAEQLLAISDHFNVSLGWLVSGEGPKEKMAPEQLVARARDISRAPTGKRMPDRATLEAIAKEIQRQAPGLPYEQMLNIAFAVADNIQGRPEKIEAYVRAELS